MKEIISPLNNKAYLHNCILLMRKYLSSTSAFHKFGLILLSLVIVTSVFGSFITPYSPIETNLNIRLSPPSRQHFFGTDELGQDVFSRVVAGSRISLFIATSILSISLFLGVIIGGIAGLSGRIVDEIIMRMTDLFLAFPPLILALALAGTLGSSLVNLILSLCIVFTPYYVRVIRMQVIVLRQREFITASRALGANDFQLLFEHILPNILPIVIVQIVLDIGYVILAAASLSFLGLGIAPPTPEWGAMILSSRSYIREAWWCTLFPGLALGLTCMGFNILGDSLRDFGDPALKVKLSYSQKGIKVTQNPNL